MKYRGVVVRFGAKGFGFIRIFGTQKSVWFHIEDVVGRLELQVGSRVEFEIGEHKRGERAILVTLLAAPDRLDRKSLSGTPATGGTSNEQA